MKGKEEVEFVLRFYVDTELPSDVEELTLSYTLFDITERVSKQDSDGLNMLAAREEFKYEP